MSETDARTALPDPTTDPAGYVLAVADLREQRARDVAEGPWCPQWVYQAVRHIGRNVDLECADHGYDCPTWDRYDGAFVAAEANPPHALAEIALWRAMAYEHRRSQIRVTADPHALTPVFRTVDTCSCGSGAWPCDRTVFAAAIAAARAYAGSPA
jgi:hypothetical protein